MKRSSWTIAFYLLLVFASGVGVGAFGHLYTVKASKLEPIAAPKKPDEWRKQFITDLDGRVKLDADQLAKLNTILDETKQRYLAVKERYRPEMQAIQSDQEQTIRSILRPAQQGGYQALLTERELEKKKAEEAKKH